MERRRVRGASVSAPADFLGVSMRRARVFSVLSCLLLVVTACGGGGSDPVIDPGGTLTASFTPTQPNPGNLETAMAPGSSSGPLVTVAINVANTNDVYGASLEVTFDPSRASFEGHSPGTLLETGGYTVHYFVAESLPGTLIISATREGQVPGVDVTAVRTLINLTFRLMVEGSSSLDFDIAASELEGPQQSIPGVTFSGGTLQAN